MISQQRFLNHRDVTSTPVSQITGNSHVCLVTINKIAKPVLLALCDWNSPLTRGSLTFPCNDDINRVGKAKDKYFLTLNGGSDRHQIHMHRTPHTKNIHTNIFMRIDDVITCPLLVEHTRHRWFPLTWGN